MEQTFLIKSIYSKDKTITELQGQIKTVFTAMNDQVKTMLALKF